MTLTSPSPSLVSWSVTSTFCWSCTICRAIPSVRKPVCRTNVLQRHDFLARCVRFLAFARWCLKTYDQGFRLHSDSLFCYLCHVRDCLGSGLGANLWPKGQMSTFRLKFLLVCWEGFSYSCWCLRFTRFEQIHVLVSYQSCASASGDWSPLIPPRAAQRGTWNPLILRLGLVCGSASSYG